MKRKLSTTTTFQLGDLICELFEEVKKETSNPDEQKVLVYFALRDLFSHQRKQPSKAA
jgi:uncharacterized protein (DUF697 family)